MTDRLRVAILGASGYTGAEAVRLALGHPRLEIRALGAQTQAGQAMEALWPHLGGAGLPDLRLVDDIDWDAIDVVLGCLPHGASAAVLAPLAERCLVIDLSADFRLADADRYARWYGAPHPASQLLSRAVYGLAEHARQALAGARLIAAPGCYPTAALLALIPPAAAGLIEPADIMIAALSGHSGAGRALKPAHLLAEGGEGASAYAVGHHRHMPEIEEKLGLAFGRPADAMRVGFTPHLVPMARGELLTISVSLAGDARPADVRASLADAYAESTFVRLLPEAVPAATQMVRGSNEAVLNVFADRLEGRAILSVAIDNLVKGSSGQAIQCLNLAMGWPEAEGLGGRALFP